MAFTRKQVVNVSKFDSNNASAGVNGAAYKWLLFVL